MADLQQKMSIAFELEHMAVGRPAPADPNVSILVHVDSVFRLGPIKSLARSAPGVEQMSLLVELQDWGRGDTAERARRCERCSKFVDGVRRGSLQNPDVVFPIY